MHLSHLIPLLCNLYSFCVCSSGGFFMAGSTRIVGEQLYPLSQSILPQVKLPEWTVPAQSYFR